MSVAAQVQGLPGARAFKTSVHRLITRGAYIPDILPSGKFIDTNNTRDPGNADVTRLRAGLIMGKCTATTGDAVAPTSGYYAPSIVDVIASAIAAGATSITISPAGAVELVRRFGASGTFKLTGPGIASGPIVTEVVTYSAVVTATGVITCTATVNHFVAGSFVQPQDGSEDPVSFLPDGYPIPVVDLDGSALAVQAWPEVPIGCVIDSTQLLPVWPSDTSLQEFLKARLRQSGPFIFSDRF